MMKNEARKNAPTPSWTGLARAVRPTLIAAIGGTGTAAAKAARERIESFIGPSHHFIAFRAFDTAFQDNREPRLVDNAEYVYLGGFNAQAVIADIVAGQAFPHWAQWLPPRLNFQQVAFGAGGIRPIGRLCYFYRRDRVEAAVQEALTTITDSDLAMRYHQKTGVRVNLEAGIDIHVIGSVCGGTGSGMFLDLAFDLRRWAEEHTNREVTVTGHLVLPEAFRRKPVVMTALEANAYTALQELDRFMNASSQDPWTVEYLQSRPEATRRAPFDHCYLLSGLQQGGTSDIDTLTAVIGEGVTLLTLSQVGQQISEGVINMAGQRKSTRDERGRACCYSSYGVLGLEIPMELLGEKLGPRLGEEILDQLSAEVSLDDASLAGDVARFKTLMRLDPERVESLVPRVSPDLIAVSAAQDESKDAAKAEFHRQLTAVRATFLQELKQQNKEELWRPDALRGHLQERLGAALLHPGGLNRNLRLLEQWAAALRDLHRQLLERADEAAAKAEATRPAADEVERGKIDLRKAWDEFERWNQLLIAEAQRELYRGQAAKVDRLLAILEQQSNAWERIQNMFRSLNVDTPRDEDSYYRTRRARASVCPLSWFQQILERRQSDLLERVLRGLVDVAEEWVSLGPKDLNERFYRLCSEAIHRHFENEANIDCDQLLAECFEHPGVRYRTQLAVLLARAEANWEVHESYPLRNNLLEISCIGVRGDSLLYGMLQESNHHISAVSEQRDDYVPIFRTEHGLSLTGLKRLGAYRQSLEDSVVQEQRYDFHFFNDKRWIVRPEFSDLNPAERQALLLFTATEMVGLLKKSPGQGYLLDGGLPLGRYRRAAYLAFKSDSQRVEQTGELVKEKQKGEDWRTQVTQQIASLQERVAKAADPHQVSEHYLSIDIYQIHQEVRALEAELRIDSVGL
jgi:hypothetical protein